MDPIKKYFEALEFAADKHKLQRRKGYLKIPYINHPIKVSKILIDVNEFDNNLIIAAILHDTLEDTDTNEQELIEKFGKAVCDLILEDTDDMDLPDKERKMLQVQNASKLSSKAKLIRIADKIANINDIVTYPINWSRKRKIRYIEWSLQVFERCKGINNQLDEMFLQTYEKARMKLK